MEELDYIISNLIFASHLPVPAETKFGLNYSQKWSSVSTFGDSFLFVEIWH